MNLKFKFFFFFLDILLAWAGRILCIIPPDLLMREKARIFEGGFCWAWPPVAGWSTNTIQGKFGGGGGD